MHALMRSLARMHGVIRKPLMMPSIDCACPCFSHCTQRFVAPSPPLPSPGFSNGLFELYQLPEFAPLQALSISQERITAAAFNTSGDWLALGCARLGQLLVWEWASEGYVLRQQGHFYDVACAAYSPDGALIATGADDAKVSRGV